MAAAAAAAPADATAFRVHDNAAFESEVLPKYFRHSNFTSFLRQINQYGFKKIDQNSWTWAHPSGNFARGRPERLRLVQRGQSSRKRKAAERDRGDSLVAAAPGGTGVDVQELVRDHAAVKEELIRVRKQQECLIAVVDDMVRMTSSAQHKAAAVEAQLNCTLRFLEMAFAKTGGVWDQKDAAEWGQLLGQRAKRQRTTPALALADKRHPDGAARPPSLQLAASAAAAAPFRIDPMGPRGMEDDVGSLEAAALSAQAGVSKLFARSDPVPGMDPAAARSDSGSSATEGDDAALVMSEEDLAALPRLSSLESLNSGDT